MGRAMERGAHDDFNDDVFKLDMLLEKLSPSERSMVYRLAESRFRRGFQHGFIAGSNSSSVEKDNELIYRWRFCRTINKEVLPPVELYPIK